MLSTPVSDLLLKILLIPMVGLWVFHLYQRRFGDAAVHKRIATLGLTAVIIGAWMAAWAFQRYAIPDKYLLVVAAAAVVVPVAARRRLLPFRRRCVQCGAALPLARTLSFDSNKCTTCDPPSNRKETA
jgi:hypothetical protein